jgi:hypothetical protein
VQHGVEAGGVDEDKAPQVEHGIPDRGKLEVPDGRLEDGRAREVELAADLNHAAGATHDARGEAAWL